MGDTKTAIIAAIIFIIVVWILSWIIISLVCKFCQPDINHPDGGVKWQHLGWLTFIPTLLATIAIILVLIWVVSLE